MKKKKAIIAMLLITIFCMPAISGCRKIDPSEHLIEFNLPNELPSHITEVVLEANYSRRDDGTIYHYMYTDEHPDYVMLDIVCERGYMPNVQFTMKTKDGEEIRTVTEKDISYHRFADYDETGTPKKEKVLYHFEPFMTESPKCDLVLSIDKLETKTAEHTLTFENVSWQGNPTDHFEGELKVSFSGAVPSKDGQPAVSVGHKYDVTELELLFRGEPWLSRYGDEFSMTVHFSEREVPTSLYDETDYDFTPLFYTYEVREGVRWLPVNLIRTVATSTTLTAIFRTDWDYDIDFIAEPLYRLCPLPET